VHELFSEMMDQAYTELGFDATGPLAVEVFALPAQGMVIIVTRSKLPGRSDADADDAYATEDDIYEMEVTLESSDEVTYAFDDFEHVVRAARIISRHLPDGGSLYAYKNRWILRFHADELDEDTIAQIISVLSEFGEAVSVTEAVLEEYGKCVMKRHAISSLVNHFG
jgi:adapter protein MecA 1/2